MMKKVKEQVSSLYLDGQKVNDQDTMFAISENILHILAGEDEEEDT